MVIVHTDRQRDHLRDLLALSSLRKENSREDEDKANETTKFKGNPKR